jgi:molybdate transport system substrate-binding protein
MILRRALPTILLATPALAQAAALSILGTGATEHPIDEIAKAFTRATGRAVRTATGNGGQVAARIRGGEAPDVVLNAGPALDGLIRDGFAVAGSRREMGRMRLAVAVKRGSALPEISTEAALGAYLRSVASIGVSDASTGATSGQHVLDLLARLAVPAQAAGGPRIAPFARGITAVQAVARGEIVTVITQASEITAVPEAVLVAPLPGHLQLITPYVAAIPTRAADPAAAAAFLAMASGPVGQAVFRAAGFAVG